MLTWDVGVPQSELLPQQASSDTPHSTSVRRLAANLAIDENCLWKGSAHGIQERSFGQDRALRHSETGTEEEEHISCRDGEEAKEEMIPSNDE